MKPTTRHMSPGGMDYRQRLVLTFVPGRERRYKEIYCLTCMGKIIETYDELAYVSDIADASGLIPDRPSAVGMRCRGNCKNWYEIKTLPGIFSVEVTRMFFLDPAKKRRELHCSYCKELFGVVQFGLVYGSSQQVTALRSDEEGFVPTFCPGRGCEHEYEITTSMI